MKVELRSIFAKAAVCALLVTTTVTAKAQFSGIGPTKSEVVGIGIGIGAAGAAIGIGVYYAVRHNHSVTGCAFVTPDGLRLRTEGDSQTYSLVGEIAAVKPGDRIRISGKKEKVDATGPRLFLVERVSKDFGSCKVQPATP